MLLFRSGLLLILKLDFHYGTHNRSWDSLFGERWDILPGDGEESLDTLIRAIRFSETQDFLFRERFPSTKVQINTCEGRFRNENQYREILNVNSKHNEGL